MSTTRRKRTPAGSGPRAGGRKLKVLLISVFHPELVRGGAQQICYELFQGLKERDDIEPVLLASVDTNQRSLYKSGARITGFDGRPGEFLYLSRDYDFLWHKVGSPALIESFAEFLDLVQPDVVHFHHFLTLGIDLLTLTRRRLPNAKIVFTLHEFLSICTAGGHMVRTFDKSQCTKATAVRCHQCFPEHGPEVFFMRERWMKKHFEAVDRFTTPSAFMIDRYVDWGLPRERITRVGNAQSNPNTNPSLNPGPNAGVLERGRANPPRNRFGFFGQLVDSKGVHVLLEAVEILRSEGFTAFHVEINGDNIKFASEQRRQQFEDFLEAEQARAPDARNVHFNGSYQVDQLKSRMLRVDWCIVPSTWAETYCLVVDEAWMFRRPVIASNCGAMVERVRDGVDGLLFEPGDARGLASLIRRASGEAGLWKKLSAQITMPAPRSQMVDEFVDIYLSL